MADRRPNSPSPTTSGRPHHLGQPAQEHPAARPPGPHRPGLRRRAENKAGRRPARASAPPPSARGGAGSSRDRLDGLADEPRPGAPRTVTDADVERVVTRTLETKPKNATHWSTRGMAKATGMSQSAVSRIWRAFGLKPHRAETFKLSTDPYFVEKVRDVVGLYMARRSGRSCCASTRRARSRPWTAPSRCCR